MSRALNKVMLIGNVGKDPELKHTPSGIPVAHFRLATSESWRDKDGTFCEHTDWHNVVAWRGLADVVSKIVRKGTRVFIEGKLRTRKYDDKNSVRHFHVEILAENILLLDNKRHYRDNMDDDKKFAFSDDDDLLVDDFDFDYDDNNCVHKVPPKDNGIDANHDEFLY